MAFEEKDLINFLFLSYHNQYFLSDLKRAPSMSAIQKPFGKPMENHA